MISKIVQRQIKQSNAFYGSLTNIFFRTYQTASLWTFYNHCSLDLYMQAMKSSNYVLPGDVTNNSRTEPSISLILYEGIFFIKGRFTPVKPGRICRNNLKLICFCHVGLQTCRLTQKNAMLRTRFCGEFPRFTPFIMQKVDDLCYYLNGSVCVNTKSTFYYKCQN